MRVKTAEVRKSETTPLLRQRPISLEQHYAVVDFENTDIAKVVSEFGAVLNRTFTLSPGIQGKMTIQSLGRVPSDALFGIFQSVLEANGLTLRRRGPRVMVVPLGYAGPNFNGHNAVSLAGELITGIIPLHHVRWEDARATLRQLAPPDSRVEIYEPANLVIVSARAPELKKFIDMTGAVDIDEAEKETARSWIYRVENGDAGRIEDVIRKTFIPGAGIQMTSYSDINALVVRCVPGTYLKFLKLLRGLDVPPRQVLIDVLVVQVRLTDSTQLGLEWLLKKTGTNFTAAGGFNQGSVGLGPDGLPFANLSHGFSTAVTGKIDTLALATVLNSLAQEDRVSVLASPQILAMDGKRAKIEIGSDVPVAKGFFQQPSTGISNTLVSAGQIRYRSVGTILSVLPHITDNDRVTLEIMQEVSQAGQPVPVAGQNFLGFDVRRAYTTASVENGETLLIGGLISENRSRTRAGIPILSKIPILGYLFSATKTTKDRTELIVMVTPHVVSGREEADAVTKRFEDRVGLVKKVFLKNREDP